MMAIWNHDRNRPDGGKGCRRGERRRRLVQDESRVRQMRDAQFRPGPQKGRRILVDRRGDVTFITSHILPDRHHADVLNMGGKKRVPHRFEAQFALPPIVQKMKRCNLSASALNSKMLIREEIK